MNTFLRRLFGLDGAAESAARAESETETVRAIIRQLDQLEPDRARYLAAFAFVLSRVANAEDGISPEETATMERLVSELGGLPEQQAILVVQIAKTQQLLAGGTENYLVTRELRQMAEPEEKERLLHCLFAVSAADDTISLSEENEVKRIAEELGIEHRELTAVRARYNDKRSILQNLPQRQG